MLNLKAPYQTLPDPDVKFEYSSANDSNLIFLREKYNLDSVAGKGSETEQIMKIISGKNL